MLALIPGFILKLLGSGIIEKVLDHKRKAMDTATEREKIKLQGEIAVLEAERERKARIAELQALEYQHGWLWFPKFLIMLSVAVYICARFSVLTWGLDDFGVAVKPLDPWLEYVAGGVIAYLFLKP